MNEKVTSEPPAQALPDVVATPLPPTTTLDAIRFVPFVILFVLILLLFDVVQRVAILFGKDVHQRSVYALNWTLTKSLLVIGVKVRVEGSDKIASGQPVIIVSNHQSLFDIPILYVVLHKHWPRFIAKQELAKWIPSVSFNLRHGGSALIDRTNPRQAIPEIQRLADSLAKDGFGAVIFPEGTRAKNGQPKLFRPTGLSTMFQHAENAHVQPVAIDNSWILSARKFGPIPAGIEIVVRILDELDRTGKNGKALVEEAQNVIHEALQDLRKNQSH